MPCREEEQKCSRGSVGTYCGKDKYDGRAAQVPEGRQTLGGYTSTFVVNEKFGVKIPFGYPLEYAGPVMCAGVTMYDPLAVNDAKNGTRVGIVGLGGLGQLGVKVAKARGCKVTVISTSERKRSFALESCGADDFVVSSDPSDMARARGSLDLILNTVPVFHDAQRVIGNAGLSDGVRTQRFARRPFDRRMVRILVVARGRAAGRVLGRRPGRDIILCCARF